MNQNHVAIVGCGYLGSEVASLWTQRGLQVTATTRHPQKLAALSKIAHKGVLLKGNDEEELANLIAANDTLLVSIGADSANAYQTAYLQTAQTFRHLAIEMDLPRRIIYVSSTSVYGDHHGRWVDEESDLLSKTEQGKILIATEELYQSLAELGWHVSIVRLAEIYGPGRELSKSFAALKGQTLPGTGENFTNMVHKADCAAGIDYILRHHLEGIYNLADDDHPTRHELYEQLSKKLSIKPPKWDPALPSHRLGNKRVSNHKIKAEGFTFRHPHRVLD